MSPLKLLPPPLPPPPPLQQINQRTVRLAHWIVDSHYADPTTVGQLVAKFNPRRHFPPHLTAANITSLWHVTVLAANVIRVRDHAEVTATINSMQLTIDQLCQTRFANVNLIRSLKGIDWRRIIDFWAESHPAAQLEIKQKVHLPVQSIQHPIDQTHAIKVAQDKIDYFLTVRRAQALFGPQVKVVNVQRVVIGEDNEQWLNIINLPRSATIIRISELRHRYYTSAVTEVLAIRPANPSPMFDYWATTLNTRFLVTIAQKSNHMKSTTPLPGITTINTDNIYQLTRLVSWLPAQNALDVVPLIAAPSAPSWTPPSLV